MNHLLKRLETLENKLDPKTCLFQVYGISKLTGEKVLLNQYPIPRVKGKGDVIFTINSGIVSEEEIQQAKKKNMEEL